MCREFIRELDNGRGSPFYIPHKAQSRGNVGEGGVITYQCEGCNEAVQDPDLSPS